MISASIDNGQACFLLYLALFMQRCCRSLCVGSFLEADGLTGDGLDGDGCMVFYFPQLRLELRRSFMQYSRLVTRAALISERENH